VKYKDIPKGGKPVPGNMHIRYKGVWDMQDFYESCANYLRERKFKFYEEKAEQFEDGPYGKGGKIYWRAEQNVDDWVTAGKDIHLLKDKRQLGCGRGMEPEAFLCGTERFLYQIYRKEEKGIRILSEIQI